MERILLVDDHVDSATMMAELLIAKGFQVEVSHDATSALQLLDTFAPHVAVLDLGLPGVDGYELALRVQATPNACRMIALTGYGREDNRERAREVGFSDFLLKPVKLDELLTALARA